MRDFRTDKTHNGDYVTDFEVMKDERGRDKIVVRFADGKVFDNIACDRENIEKLCAKQEEQAKKGIANIPVFERRRTISGLISSACFATGMVGSAAITNALEEAANSSFDPLVVALSVGTVSIVAALPGICKLIKNHGIVKELRKIEYRDKHRAELDAFQDYPNGLAGIDHKTGTALAKRSQGGNDPFGVHYISTYTEGDLKSIVDNVRREGAFQFVYRKAPTSSQK